MSTLCKRGDAYATQEVSYSAASSVFAALFSSVEVTTSIATFIIGKNNLTSSTPFFSVLIFCIYQDRFSSTELEPNNKNLLILNYLLLLLMMYENYQKCLIRTFRWPKVIKTLISIQELIMEWLHLHKIPEMDTKMLSNETFWMIFKHSVFYT